jgi:prepilin-type processing-associated H-X9-DG protein
MKTDALEKGVLGTNVMDATAPNPEDSRPTRDVPTLEYASAATGGLGQTAATLSLVCAVVFVPLFFLVPDRWWYADSVLIFLGVLMSLPVAAIACGLIARSRRAGISVGARRKAGAGVAVGAMEIALVLFVAFTLPTQGRSRPLANRVKCMSNLRMIGQGISLYAMDNKGRFPPDLDALMFTQDLTFEVLVCPSTNDTKAVGPTTQAALQAMHAEPGHCSYIYVGGSLTSQTATPQHVMAYEPMSNNRGAGMNVLFGDGSVQFLNQRESTYVLAELKAGHNPPRPKTDSTTARTTIR